MGWEWDLTWDLPKLRSEIISAIRSGKRVGIQSDFRARILRYIVYHVHVDRLECYDRSLQIGQFKLRLTLTCLGTQRSSFSWESDRPFFGSSCLKAEEGFFRLTIPVNIKTGPEQLSAWRVEFEVLHKFPAAPIYTVVGRSWIDPPTLVRASAVDVYSTFDLENVLVRINFTKTVHSGVGINLFRTAVRAVIFLSRLGRLLGLNRKRELSQLEREVRILNTRNQTYQQAEQLALMTKTIETMTKYMESGSKPDDWLKAMHRSGVFQQEPDRRTEQQISELKSQIETLRSEILKSVIDRPPPVVQIISPEPRSPPIPEEPVVRNPINPGGMFSWLTRSSEVPSDIPPLPITVKEDLPVTVKEEPKPQEEPKKSLNLPPQTSGSVKDRMAAKPVPEPVVKEKIIPKRQPSILPDAKISEPVLKRPPSVVESLKSSKRSIQEEAVITEAVLVEEGGQQEIQAADLVDTDAITQATEQVTAAVTNTVSSWWGAMTAAVAPVEPTPAPVARVNPAPLVAAVTKTPPTDKASKQSSQASTPKPVEEPIVVKKEEAKKVVSKTAGVVKQSPKAPVGAKKTAPVAAKTPVVPKPKIDPVKAKIEIIMKVKAIEEKRKADIANTEKTIVELAKKLPPVDKFKFIGLPGPPPFTPKAKAAPKESAVLPAALAPPPVAEEELEPVDQEEEPGN